MWLFAGCLSLLTLVPAGSAWRQERLRLEVRLDTILADDPLQIGAFAPAAAAATLVVTFAGAVLIHGRRGALVRHALRRAGVLPAFLALLAAPRMTLAQPQGRSRVTVVDMTPKFLAFYDSATARRANADARWELWQRLYNFAAVPPTAFGREMARRLLDSAWARYPAVLPRIRQGLAGLRIVPDSVLHRVTDLLGCGDTVRVGLRLFVGGFEGNAFAYNAADGTPLVAIPVEAGDAKLSMAHEFAHAIHRSSACAGFPPGYQQSLAHLVLSEGVAMRVTERLIPGHPATYYLHGSADWLASARAKRDAILRGVRDHLRRNDEATVQRFTFGTGTSGISREAYYAGWEVTGALLRMGLSLREIATTPASKVPELVERAIDHLMSARQDR